MPTTFDLSFDTDDVIEANDPKQFGVPLQNVEKGKTWYGAATWSDGGATDDYSVTVNSGAQDFAPALEAGLMVHFKADAANAQGPARIDVNSLGFQAIKKRANQDLNAGDIAAGQMVVLLYDGTNFQLVGDTAIQPGDLPGGIDAADIADGSVSNTEFQALNGVTSGIQGQLDGKASTTHTHELADLTDVNLTGLQDGDTLVWDDTAQEWVPGTLAGGTLDGSGTAGQVATWQDADTLTGVNQVPPAQGGTGADLSATGPGYLKQASSGANVTVGAIAAGDLPTAIDAAKIADGSVSNAEFQALNGVTSGLQGQLDGKASATHTHAASDITSGTLGAVRGGTGQSAVAAGDLLYGSAADTWSRLGIGSAGQILKVASGLPSWGNPDLATAAVSGAMYVAASGSSGAFTGNTSPAYAAYTSGDLIALKANHSPTGATTLNLNSLGTKAIKRTFSDGTRFDTVQGDLVTGRVYWLLYDGTDFLLLNSGLVPGCLAVRATHQPVNTGAWASLQFTSTDEFDTHNYHDTSSNSEQLIVPDGLGGTYLAIGLAHVGTDAAPAAGITVTCAIVKKSGSGGSIVNLYAIACRHNEGTAIATTYMQPIVAIVKLNDDDRLLLQVFHNHGSPRNCQGFLGMVRLGDA